MKHHTHKDSSKKSEKKIDLPGIYRQQRGRGGLRLLRVGEEIKHILSGILMRGEVKNLDLLNTMLTITEVKVSPDLRHADVYFLPLDKTGQDIDLIRDAFGEEAPLLRHHLAQNLTMKYVPQLHFKYDTRYERVQEIESLLRNEKVQEDLKKPS